MPNPYVGPHPFEPGQPIFGRAREIEELYYLLSAERIVLLHSPSGAGKSSLIQAGMLARVANTFDVWGPVRVHAAGPSNRYVRSVLAGLEFQIPEARRRPEEEVGAMTLAAYAEKRPRRRSAPGNVLLIFDQFEEVLTADPLAVDAKREFFMQLGELLQNPHYWALFSLREDYLAPLDPYAKLVPSHLKNRFRLDLLSCDAAREAIAKPADLGGRSFTEDALSKLVLDLATIKVQQADGSFRDETGQHVEPVQLQVVCQDLWEKTEERKRDKIDVGDITECGDVKQALAVYYAKQVEKISGGSMEQIGAQLAAHASEMTEKLANIRAMMPGENASGDLATAVQNLNALMAEHKPLLEQNNILLTQRVKRENAIREWMDAKLITPDGIRSQVLRGVDRSEGLDNTLVESLVNCHLVRREQRMGSVWYELAHDRLIEPVRGNNESWWSKQAPLLRAARRWSKNGRDPRYLYLGEQLKEVKAGLDKDSAEPIVSQFLEHCDAAEEDRQFKESAERKMRRLVGWLVVLFGAGFLASLWSMVHLAVSETMDALQRYLFGLAIAVPSGAIAGAGILGVVRRRERITELLRKLTRKHRMDASLQSSLDTETSVHVVAGGTARDESSPFDPWETRTLQFAPLWTFLAVAGADGRLSRSEARSLIKGIRQCVSACGSRFQPVFQSLLKERESVLSEFVDDPRTSLRGFSDVASILNTKSTPQEASVFKRTIVEIAGQIARRSGAGNTEVTAAVTMVEQALDGKPVTSARVRYYRHSGLYSDAGVLKAVLTGGLLAVVLGFPYLWIQRVIPFVEAKVFLAAAYGALIGLGVDWALNSTRVRNPAAVRLAAISGVLAAVYWNWVWFIFAVWKGPKIVLPILPLIVAKLGIGAFVAATKMGGWTILVRVAEVPIIAFCAYALGSKSLGSMFCERCGAWCDETKNLRCFPIVDQEELRQRLEHGDIDFLADASVDAAYVTTTNEWLSAGLHSCKQCGSSHALSVQHVTAKLNDKGKRELTEVPWIDRLLVTPRVADRLAAGIVPRATR